MNENIFDEIKIEDDSGDHKYFTIVPNYVLNHSTVVDQGVYLQMKRVAGEGGVCDISHRTLLTKLGIGYHTFNKSLEYLLSRGWIEKIGMKEVQTKGGIQKINVYKVNDIWKQNNEYYKGASRLAPLPQGASRLAHEGASRLAPIEELKREEGTLTPHEEAKKFFSDKNYADEYLKDFIKKEGYTPSYLKEILRGFYNHWTEPSKSGKQQKWELERTFEISRRIKTWIRIGEKYNKDK